MPRKLISTDIELIEKAQLLFWENGYRSITPETLAKNLGVSISAVYNSLGKDELFMESLENYLTNYPEACVKIYLDSDKGLEIIKDIHHQIIDSFSSGTFLKKCMVVNTMVEMKKELNGLNDIYDRYFVGLRNALVVALERAYVLGEIKHKSRIAQYSEVLVNLVFSINILCLVMTQDELRTYVDRQFSLIQ